MAPFVPSSRARFRRILSWALVTPVCLAGVAAASLGWQVRNFVIDSRAVHRANESLILITTLQKQLLSAEISLQGYLLTSDHAVLGVYSEAVTDIDRLLPELQDRLQGRDVPRQRGADVLRLWPQWQELATRRLTEPGPRLETSRLAQDVSGRLRDQLQALASDEQSVVDSRSARVERSGRRTVIAALLLTMLLAGFVWLVTRKAFASILRSYDDSARELGERADALVESERRFRTMANMAPVLIWVSDVHHHSSWFNQTWLDFTGRKLIEEVGQGWTVGIHPDDAARVAAVFRAASEVRRAFRLEYRLRRRDGVYRWIFDVGVPRYAPDGMFLGYIGSCLDITERREDADRLARLSQELQTAVLVRDDFLSIAAHELKTPLTSLSLQLELLYREAHRRLASDHSDECLRRGIEMSRHQVKRVSDLVDRLLDVSRVRTGHLEFEWTRVDMVELVREVVERFRVMGGTVGPEIFVHGADSLLCVCDRLRVDQVVTNLLSNAIKYGLGRPVHVSVENTEGLRAQLRVRDTGVGLSEEERVGIFERFARVPSRRNIHGLGLGLYIVREIVQGHGGTISVASVVNEGSEFTVELPLDGPRDFARGHELDAIWMSSV